MILPLKPTPGSTTSFPRYRHLGSLDLAPSRFACHCIFHIRYELLVHMLARIWSSPLSEELPSLDLQNIQLNHFCPTPPIYLARSNVVVIDFLRRLAPSSLWQAAVFGHHIVRLSLAEPDCDAVAVPDVNVDRNRFSQVSYHQDIITSP